MSDKSSTKEPEVPTRRSCGTMPVHERLLRTDPHYAAARAASENYHFEYMRRGPMQARSGVTVIPVVVHVVYNTAAQNISAAQIKSQIDVLNRDFRKTNSDVSSTPSVFIPLTSDGRIEFELAEKNPSGGATNGITRTHTDRPSFSHDDSVKSAATGGADAWPADEYLNIWVCQLSGGLLGYAQFPGGPVSTDGVVILHTAFGTTGTAAAPFNLGRTTTHEIGHWLNLRHIWGDDGTGCHGSDFVDDTPNQAGPNYGTPSFPHVTCGNGPNGDLFMNYMDYVDDQAMVMFSAGQVNRMQACLDGDRSSIGYTKKEQVIQQGIYTIQQKSNDRFMDAHESGDFSVVTRNAQNNDTQRWILTPVGGVYAIQQKSNGRFMDAHESGDFSVVTRNAQNNDTQRWVLMHLGSNLCTYTIQQLSNGRFMDAHGSGDFSVVTRPAQNNDTQRWILTPLDFSNAYTIQQKSNDRFMDAHESGDFSVVTRTKQNNDTQRWILTPVGGVYTIQQKSNARFMDAHGSGDFSVVTRPAQNNDTQRWVIMNLGGDTYTIQQLSNSRFVDAHESGDFSVVTRPAQNNDTQRWLIKAV